MDCDWNDYQYWAGCGWCGTCDSSTIISEINSNEPYFGNVGNEGFLSSIWTSVLNTITSSLWEPYMFCTR
jgi:hypothetical protein